MLIAPIRVRIRYISEPNVYFRYLFFKYTVLPEKKRRKRGFLRKFVKKIFPNKHRKKKKTSEAKASKKKQKSSTSDMLDFLSYITDFLRHILKGFFKRLKIKVAKINIIVATDDAAKTAITYGIVSQAVSYLLEVLNNVTNFKRAFKSEINVLSDFIANESKMELDIKLYYRPIWAIGLLFSTLIHVIKKTYKEKSNTRNKNF